MNTDIGTTTINADDYGMSATINTAILRCFTHGWISTATIMANMPGFGEACEAIHDHELVDKIGIHVVLSAGKPLSTKIKGRKVFCDANGYFKPRPMGNRFFYLNNEDKEALSQEIIAQIEQCRMNGLSLTHIDFHHNYHAGWAIAGLARTIAKQYGIPYIRLMRNTCDEANIRRRIYAAIFNARLHRSGMGRTIYFGSIYNYISFLDRYPDRVVDGAFEIMVHPDLDAHGLTIDRERGEPMDYLLRKAHLIRPSDSMPKAINSRHLG